MTSKRALEGLDLEAHLADPAIRQRFVTRMFDAIAPRYDRFTRVFSFGMDAGWKRELLAPLRDWLPERGALLDLACGTGDLARAASAMVPSARVTGIDASPEMIALAQAGVRDAERQRFLVGDMMRLPVPDASVDVVTVGYGVRNVPDPRGAVAEIARVLRPGGRVLVLDFYRPAWAPWRVLFLWYLRVAGNVVGWLWHREPVVYGYIAPSIRTYVTAGEFSRMLESAGLEVERERKKLLGGIALHVAVKGSLLR